MTQAMVGAARLRATMNASASARWVGTRLRHSVRSIGSRSADQMIAGVANPQTSRKTIGSSTGARSAKRSLGPRTTISERARTYRIAASHNATMTRPAIARYDGGGGAVSGLPKRETPSDSRAVAVAVNMLAKVVR